MPLLCNPVSYMLGTEKVELFYISVLCDYLGRSSQTLRRWEIAGILPKTPFRDKVGKRLYTQEQIDAIVKVAEVCKIGQGREIRNSLFQSKLQKTLDPIHEKYIKTIQGGNQQ